MLLSLSKGALVGDRWVSTWRQTLAGQQTVTRRDGWVEWSPAWGAGVAESCAAGRVEHRPWDALRFIERDWFSKSPHAIYIDGALEAPTSVFFAWTPRLHSGDVLEIIEWSPRIGPRWVCEICGWLGPAKFAVHERCEICGLRSLMSHRPPRRGHYVEITEPLSRPPLGDLTPEEVAAEGFHDLPVEDFVRLLLDRNRLPDGWEDLRFTRIAYRFLGAERP